MPSTSCFQLNLILSGILGHFVLWSPERRVTACRGGGIPTDRLGGLGQRDSGRWVKSCGDPAADAVGELSLRWVWGGVYFPSLSHDFFSQLWFLAGLTFQFPELILGSWDWLFLSDPGPRLSPSFDEFRPTGSHNPHSFTLLSSQWGGTVVPVPPPAQRPSGSRKLNRGAMEWESWKAQRGWGWGATSCLQIRR